MIWRALADRFRNSPGIVGYDLYNEPNAAPLPPGLFEDALMWPFFIRLIDSVAQEDPNHLFIVEGPLLLTPPVLEMRPRMDHVTGGQLVYAPHVYVGSVVPPAYFDDPTAVVRHVNAQAEEARQLPAPAWWGELGVDTGKPYAVPWTDEVLDAFDDLDVGWAWWQWRQDWGWGVRNQSGDFINWDFLQHLARPFIVASPGGVQGERGDGVVGRLTIDVEADHEDLPVSVAWPTTTLPPPTALGTCLDAARFYPQQARLELLLHPGIGCTIHIAAEPSAT
jgi:hypothetical protein